MSACQSFCSMYDKNEHGAAELTTKTPENTKQDPRWTSANSMRSWRKTDGGLSYLMGLGAVGRHPETSSSLWSYTSNLHPSIPPPQPQATCVGSHDLYLCPCVCIMCNKVVPLGALSFLQIHYQLIGIPDYWLEVTNKYQSRAQRVGGVYIFLNSLMFVTLQAL